MTNTLHQLILITSLACLVSTQAQAAHMLREPSGVLVRSVLSWERAEGLEFVQNGQTIDSKAFAMTSEHLFFGSAPCDASRYRVKHDNATSDDSWISLDHLCLRPDGSQVRMVFTSDIAGNATSRKVMGDVIQSLNVQGQTQQLVIDAGNMVSEGSDDQWHQYWALAESYAATTPVVALTGELEYRLDPQLVRRNALLDSVDTKRGYYYIDLGPILLVFLNSNIDHMDERQRTEQARWLNVTLAYFGVQKPTYVVLHHSLTDIRPGSDIDRYVRNTLWPSFRAYHVRAVLSGHAPAYRRLQDGLMLRLESDGSTMTTLHADFRGAIELTTYSLTDGHVVDTATLE